MLGTRFPIRRVSAADANRHFSRILRDVRSGEIVTVTSRGIDVAMIVPIGEVASVAGERAKADLLARLRRRKSAGATWIRDELYDRDRT